LQVLELRTLELLEGSTHAALEFFGGERCEVESLYFGRKPRRLHGFVLGAEEASSVNSLPCTGSG